MRCDRRGFLVASGLVLAGCASDRARPAATSSSAGPTSTTTAPSSVASSTAPSVPTRAQMEAKLAGATPKQWGLDVDGVVQRAQSTQVAITLDACGGPSGSGFDQQLIDFLSTTKTPATLFLNGRWIESNPDLTKQLIANDLFCIANHGTRHVPLSVSGQAAYKISGTASVGEAYDEVMGNQQTLTALMGEPPKFFRPGTAYYDEVSAQLVRELGLLPVNFDVNADGGATFSAAQVIQETSTARPGSICIGHFNQPSGSTYEGLCEAIAKLKAEGLQFARLDEMTLA